MAQLASAMECEPLPKDEAIHLLEHLLFHRERHGRKGRARWPLVVRGIITELELRNQLMAHSTTELAHHNNVDHPEHFAGDFRELGLAFEMGLYGREAKLCSADFYDHAGNPNRVRVIERLAVDCPLSPAQLCEGLQRQLNLPEFHNGHSEEDWRSAVEAGITYEVSRPSKRAGSLDAWDRSVPVGCNVAITIAASKYEPPGQDPDWDSTEVVERVGQGMADLLQQPVYHHRSWLGPDKIVMRDRVFQPSSNAKSDS